MHPPAKRPRLARDNFDDASQLTKASQHHPSSSQPLNSFEGHGMQNAGNFKINGNLTMNINRQPNTSMEVGKHQILLESLRFDQIDARQLSIKKAHARTCEWFLNTHEYVNWTQQNTPHNKHNFLWIKGKPGAGKSTLMNFLLGKLRNQIRQAQDQAILLSFFFNARGQDLEKTTMGLYRSLLVQLLEARPELQYILDNVRIGHNWTIESLTYLFEEAVRGLGDTPVVCLIDALDECEERRIRDMVVFLRDHIVQDTFRICLASRHYPHINVRTDLNLVLEDQSEHNEDIRSYLNSALAIEDGALAEPIRCELQKKARGVFMWVVLVVDILNREYDAGREHVLRGDALYARIRALPGDLHDLFLDILTRDTNNMDGLLLCIQWILFARQPLTPRQLYLAMFSGMEPRYLASGHLENMTERAIKQYILYNSKGLAEATKSTSSPTIQFIHESVRDFLLKEDGLSKIKRDFSTDVVGRSHNRLKQCCLTYMDMVEVTGHEGISVKRIARRSPFLEYAQNGILYHADQAQTHHVSQQDFMATFPRSRWVKCHNSLERYKSRHYTFEVSLLYILAEAGMSALIRAHSNRQSCFNIENERYGLPILAASATKNTVAIQTMLELEVERLSESSLKSLHCMMPPNLDISYAAGRDFIFRKHEDLLYQLIEYGNEKASLFFLSTRQCDIHVTDRRGKTLLMAAAQKGFAVLVAALLQRGANVLAVDKDGQKPLDMASYQGHAKIVKMLIDHDAAVLSVDETGRALCSASSRGHIEVAKLLTDHGANMSATCDELRQTPLHNALCEGHNEIAEILIDHGADISAVDVRGNTPLHIASRQGHAKLVQLLLGRGANVSAVDIFGRTPLHRASDTGRTKSGKLLINYGADVSAADKGGETPLHAASRQGHGKVAKLLIDHGANVMAVDLYGQTPLDRAQSVEVAKLLIDHGANVMAVDLSGRTPLDKAQSVEVAKLLIDHGANVLAVDKDGQTPLHTAWDTDRAKLLIDHGANVLAVDKDGSTPLHTALYRMNKEVAKLLISYGADLLAVDKGGQTPLHIARSADWAKLLIDHGANVLAVDKDGSTPLHTALYRGNEGVAELLISYGADLLAVDKGGRTVLHFAALHGRFAKVAELLINRGADVLAVDKNGRTALHFAARRSDEFTEVAELLINRGADVLAVDKDGWTALHFAARRSDKSTEIAELPVRINRSANVLAADTDEWTAFHNEVAELLINRGANVLAVDKDGQTPLDIASAAGNTEMARLFIERGAQKRVYPTSPSPYPLANPPDQTR